MGENTIPVDTSEVTLMLTLFCLHTENQSSTYLLHSFTQNKNKVHTKPARTFTSKIAGKKGKWSWSQSVYHSSLELELPHFGAGLAAQPAWHHEMRGAPLTPVVGLSTIL